MAENPADKPVPAEQPIWWKRYAGAIAFLLVLGLGTFYYTVNAGRAEDAQRAADAAHHSLAATNKAVIEAARINCKADRKFRLQYRERGRAVVELLRVIVDRAEALRQTEQLRETTREQLAKLRPFLNNIQILPVPKCGEQTMRLREALADAQRRGSG